MEITQANNFLLYRNKKNEVKVDVLLIELSHLVLIKVLFHGILKI